MKSDRTVWLLERDHNWLSATNSSGFDGSFATHVIRRLRRGSVAADLVRQVLLAPDSPVDLAAMLAPLYASSVPMDGETERTLLALAHRELNQPMATLIRDHSIEAVTSARMGGS